LKEAAKAQRRSLNSYIIHVLELDAEERARRARMQANRDIPPVREITAIHGRQHRTDSRGPGTWTLSVSTTLVGVAQAFLPVRYSECSKIAKMCRRAATSQGKRRRQK